MRRRSELYPDYCAEIAEIRKNGITVELLTKIINDHEANSRKNKELYDRYRVLQEAIPIFARKPRFHENGSQSINNQINNNFFGELIDTKVGYYAGKPVLYKYGEDSESEEETGGEEATERASKELKEFVKRNNMYDIDMETTKFASICGYCGRLFYIDTEGKERILIIPPYETIILSEREITEPEFAIRYYICQDINDREIVKVEFYDKTNIYYYEGSKDAYIYRDTKCHLFDYCPLQGIPNNREMMGDAEGVLSLIDDYDCAFSDSSNDIESFANAYMVYKNAKLRDESTELTNESGIIEIEPDDPAAPYDVYYLTKNLDGSFVNTHLDRAEDNIYRFGKSPNLNDPEFNASSGVALKIKMTGLETKCGMFQAKHQSANMYMFKLLASSYKKKGIAFDEMQCNTSYRRNFPVDFLGDAQAVQALITAGLPKEIAFKALSFIDDIDYVLQLIEDEKDGIPSLKEENDVPTTIQAEEALFEAKKKEKKNEWKS